MLITHDLAIGGLQQVVVNICKTIDREKYDVSVLCLRNLGEYVPEIEKLGIKVFLLPLKNSTDYLSFLKVAKILRQQKIDVIHTHNSQPMIDGTIGALLAGVKSIVHTEHGTIFPDKKRYMVAEWFVSHFIYKIVGVSEPTAKNLEHFLKINPKKILTIMNGIDGQKFDIKIDAAKKRQELGLNKNDIILGTIGRLVMEKGYTYLLKAMHLIMHHCPQIKLLIVGDGYLSNSLKNEAATLNLNNNVIFTGNRLDVPELLKIFDIFILSSISEGLPIVLLEALAAKCPIIATDVGGIPKVITNGINGSLIPAKNPALLGEEILKLVKNRNIRERYVENGVSIFNEKFDVKKMTQKYEKLYVHAEIEP
jgi:glycosyltransferase involved in cell wall biosynthesis